MKKLEKPKIDPKLIIKREPEMRKEISGGEALIFIPILFLIYILTLIL